MRWIVTIEGSKLALAADGFEIETEIVVRAVKSGLRVAEVASFEQPRGHGASRSECVARRQACAADGVDAPLQTWRARGGRPRDT